MIYVQALELINLAVKNDVLREENNKVFVYRKGTAQRQEGWYLDDKDTVAKELMKSENGQRVIIDALKEKGIDYIPKNYSWLSNHNSMNEGEI